MQRTEKTDENNIKTRQKIKKGRSKRQSAWLIIQWLPLLSLRCCSAIAPLLSLLLSLHSCSCYCLRCRFVVAPLLHRCRSAVAPLSLRCRSAVAPLLLLLLRCRCCRSCCCNGITDAITPAVTHGHHLKRQNQGNGFHW